MADLSDKRYVVTGKHGMYDPENPIGFESDDLLSAEAKANEYVEEYGFYKTWVIDLHNHARRVFLASARDTNHGGD